MFDLSFTGCYAGNVTVNPVIGPDIPESTAQAATLAVFLRIVQTRYGAVRGSIERCAGSVVRYVSPRYSPAPDMGIINGVCYD